MFTYIVIANIYQINTVLRFFMIFLIFPQSCQLSIRNMLTIQMRKTRLEKLKHLTDLKLIKAIFLSDSQICCLVHYAIPVPGSHCIRMRYNLGIN